VARLKHSAAVAMTGVRKYRRIVEACAKLRCGSALIDGEVVVQNEDGVSDFVALRAAIDREPHRPSTCCFSMARTGAESG
jgi:ATP-dependent DNA ligase